MKVLGQVEIYESIIESLSDSKLVDVYNDFAEKQNYSPILPMLEIENQFGEDSFLANYNKIDHDNFDIDDDWFMYDSRGYIVSGEGKYLVEDCSQFDKYSNRLRSVSFRHKNGCSSAYVLEVEPLIRKWLKC